MDPKLDYETALLTELARGMCSADWLVQPWASEKAMALAIASEQE